MTTSTREQILSAFRDLGPCGLRPVVEALELDHAEAKTIVEQLITDRHLYQQSNKQYTVKQPREQHPLRKASRQSYEERTASDKQLANLNDHMTELGAPDVKPVLARARQFMDYQAAELSKARESLGVPRGESLCDAKHTPRITATQPKPVAECTISELTDRITEYRQAIKEIQSYVKPLLD